MSNSSNKTRFLSTAICGYKLDESNLQHAHEMKNAIDALNTRVFGEYPRDFQDKHFFFCWLRDLINGCGGISSMDKVHKLMDLIDGLNERVFGKYPQDRVEKYLQICFLQKSVNMAGGLEHAQVVHLN